MCPSSTYSHYYLQPFWPSSSVIYNGKWDLNLSGEFTALSTLEKFEKQVRNMKF